jgi:hypothetical protein
VLGPVRGRQVVRLVPYSARYVDETGAESTEAETLRFERVGSAGRWLVTDVTATDLSAARDAAAAILDRYFAALERGDDATVARLLLGAAPTVPAERDDLGRLADEGMLAGGTPDDLARAVEAWCASGAACRAPDALRTEVTPRHTVRVVATYRIDGRDYDVVYTAAEVGGVAEVIGLPPRP